MIYMIILLILTIMQILSNYLSFAPDP
jgi:hypothetical protein